MPRAVQDIDNGGVQLASRNMANVLNEEKKQQILDLGRLGWSLRRIQEATRVRRETISGYLKAAGITVWRPGGWSRQGQPKPAMQVITGSMSELPAVNPNINPENLPSKRKSNREDSKPAIEVTTGFGVELRGPEAAKPSSSLSTRVFRAFRLVAAALKLRPSEVGFREPFFPYSTAHVRVYRIHPLRKW